MSTVEVAQTSKGKKHRRKKATGKSKAGNEANRETGSTDEPEPELNDGAIEEPETPTVELYPRKVT